MLLRLPDLKRRDLGQANAKWLTELHAGSSSQRHHTAQGAAFPGTRFPAALALGFSLLFMQLVSPKQQYLDLIK